MALTVSALGDNAPANFIAAVNAEAIPALSSAFRKPLYEPAHVGVIAWSAYVERVWRDKVAAAVGQQGDDTFWNVARSRGVIANEPGLVEQAGTPQLAQATAAPTAAGTTLVLTPSKMMGDGRAANNAWLLEAPDPITKVTWDNCLAMGLNAAQTLADKPLKTNDMVTVTVGDYSFQLPVIIVPGMAENTIEAFLGWGRGLAAGVVAEDQHGRDLKAWPVKSNLFELTAGQSFYHDGVSLTKTGYTYKLAVTQGHQFMDDRAIALHDVLELHQKDKKFAHRGKHHALWEYGKGTGAINSVLVTGNHAADVKGAPDAIAKLEANNLNAWGETHVYTGRRWGMVVDMNACTGCNACVVACSVENNVPVVGRDEVRLGREMHWIRIDRYYSTPEDTDGDSTTRPSQTISDDDLIEIFQQPIMCQHCGHAPCEEVCPALAIVHDKEGVNVQVYNRCIGTRYCANNCPYKVRRFNFYEYAKYRFGPQGSGHPFARVFRNLLKDQRTSSNEELNNLPLHMVLNPEVTQRSKGIMEKCSFCEQRTRKIREEEKRTGKAYDDADIRNTVACAQTCPSEAITFGDLNDPFSSVNQAADENKHGYKILDKYINTRPAVTYLRHIRNRPPTGAEQYAYNVGHGIDGKGHNGDGHDSHGGGH